MTTIYSRKQLAECAMRELEKRRENYPKWVKDRRMNQRTADDQIAKMQDIYRLILAAPDSLFEGEVRDEC